MNLHTTFQDNNNVYTNKNKKQCRDLTRALLKDVSHLILLLLYAKFVSYHCNSKPKHEIRKQTSDEFDKYVLNGIPCNIVEWLLMSDFFIILRHT